MYFTFFQNAVQATQNAALKILYFELLKDAGLVLETVSNASVNKTAFTACVSIQSQIVFTRVFTDINKLTGSQGTSELLVLAEDEGVLNPTTFPFK